jgi:AcrR family transcriptional regulator
MRTRDKAKEDALRDEALKMIVKEGFDGLSMHKLAKAAGVSPATIYIYFKDRDDLIVQLYSEEMKKMTEATLEGFDPAMRFDAGLKIQWINRARYCLKHPAQAHFMEQIRFSPLHEKAIKATDGAFINAMRAFVANAIKRKELIKVPVEVYWSIAFAPLYQLVKYHMQGRGLPGTGKFNLDEKILNQTLELVLKALKPNPKEA